MAALIICVSCSMLGGKWWERAGKGKGESAGPASQRSAGNQQEAVERGHHAREGALKKPVWQDLIREPRQHFKDRLMVSYLSISKHWEPPQRSKPTESFL